MKKIAILYSNYSATIDSIEYKINNIAKTDKLSDIKNVDLLSYDLVVLSNFNEEIKDINAINVHYSLLPSFSGKTPVKDAILNGNKVTGLTFYYTSPFKIIAQYPVFINSETHYDELLQELNYLEQTIYPLIVEKILKNETFDINTLMKNNGCSGNCAGCNGCKN